MNNKNNIYIFDSNSLIAAKNSYYNPLFAKGFWDWLKTGLEHDLFLSIEQVRRELLNGNDDDFLKILAQESEIDSFWISTSDTRTVQNFAILTNWTRNEWTNRFITKNIDKQRNFQIEQSCSHFASLDNADGWLVAAALSLQSDGRKKSIIVTNERCDTVSPKRITIPDVAKEHGIKCCSVFDVLNKHAIDHFSFNHNPPV